MFIIARYEVSEKQLSRIARRFHLPPDASPEAITARLREYLQVQGEQAIDALTLPLMAQAQAPLARRRTRRETVAARA